jgi:hypothetical protein
MADIQKQFETFHGEIRMDYERNSELAEKRDVVLNKIAASLKKNGRPGFTQLLQGSYKMKTGVKPLRGFECDIDVGLRFVLDKSVTATEVRGWVLEAIGEHTNSVESKRPCIRVRYSAGYHLDLVIYAWEERAGLPDIYRFAHKDRGWVDADPPTLLKHVADAAKRFAGTEDSTGIDQLRRVIRYLKRWDDGRSRRTKRARCPGWASRCSRSTTSPRPRSHSTPSLTTLARCSTSQPWRPRWRPSRQASRRPSTKISTHTFRVLRWTPSSRASAA